MRYFYSVAIGCVWSCIGFGILIGSQIMIDSNYICDFDERIECLKSFDSIRFLFGFFAIVFGMLLAIVFAKKESTLHSLDSVKENKS